MKDKIKKIEKLFLIFIIYAFGGWCYECSWFLIFRHRIVNRGFLTGPYLPIFGLGFILLYLAVKYIIRPSKNKKTSDLIKEFILILILATAFEYTSHYLLDHLFGIRLWTYKKNFLNINGRICFEASLGFAIGGVLSINYIQPAIEKLYSRINNKKFFHLVMLIIFIIFFTDLILTVSSYVH